jgi:hypothetical protein
MRRILPSAAVLATVLAVLPAATAAANDPGAGSRTPTDLAVIGDVPYGGAQISALPANIAQINADPSVRLVMHLGDIKNGSSACTDTYFGQIRTAFDSFDDPLVYTPGDNEWTDCHRINNGGFTPTERLAKLRSVFFDEPGETLGVHARDVAHQRAPFVENVSWTQSQTVFATLNVPGSNNDLAPWFSQQNPAAVVTPAQQQEYDSRLQADLRWLDRTFDHAERRHAAAVVLGIQADMWDPAAVAGNQVSGFTPLVQRLAERAREFDRPVLLLNGDSHVYGSDHPLDTPEGLALYGVDKPVPNLTRITVQGSDSKPREYVRLHVDPRQPGVFSWETVVYATQ